MYFMHFLHSDKHEMWNRTQRCSLIGCAVDKIENQTAKEHCAAERQ